MLSCCTDFIDVMSYKEWLELIKCTYNQKDGADQPQFHSIISLLDFRPWTATVADSLHCASVMYFQLESQLILFCTILCRDKKRMKKK